MNRDNRPGSRQRGYNATWERVRKMKLNNQPLCEHCEKRARISSAVLVHHIDHDPRNNSGENLMSVCRDCHDELHSAVRGCDLNGNPIDPAHPWNTEGGA